MALERTLSIVKPDGVARNLIGEVYRRLEGAGLRVIAARMLRLSREQAEQFYQVHRERPFYGSLVRYMTSGPVMVQVLEGENAVMANRDIMGATDPKTLKTERLHSRHFLRLMGPTRALSSIRGQDVQEGYINQRAKESWRRSRSPRRPSRGWRSSSRRRP